MDAFGGVLAGTWIAGIVLAFVLAIAWIIVPFAIIGTKPILRDILRELNSQNELLRQLAAQTKDPGELPPSLRSGSLLTSGDKAPTEPNPGSVMPHG